MTIKVSLLVMSLLSSTLWVTMVNAELHSEQTIQQQTIKLSIQNMTCSMCPITIKKALQKVEGVQQVVVDYDSKTAVITFDHRKTDSAALIMATTNAGYPSTLDASSSR
jgi:mercuric ion binding protein